MMQYLSIARVVPNQVKIHSQKLFIKILQKSIYFSAWSKNSYQIDFGHILCTRSLSMTEYLSIFRAIPVWSRVQGRKTLLLFRLKTHIFRTHFDQMLYTISFSNEMQNLYIARAVPHQGYLFKNEFSILVEVKITFESIFLKFYAQVHCR